MNHYLRLLGCKVRDAVTGFEGVVTSISFDLYGCVMVWLTPSVGEDGKSRDGFWIDAKRAGVLDATPVMTPPDFAAIVPGAEIGPEEKGAPVNRM